MKTPARILFLAKGNACHVEKEGVHFFSITMKLQTEEHEDLICLNILWDAESSEVVTPYHMCGNTVHSAIHNILVDNGYFGVQFH